MKENSKYLKYKDELFINSYYDLFLYLDDINSYVNSILKYHYSSDEERNKLYLDEILMYLSSIEEIIINIKYFLFIKNCFIMDNYFDSSSDDLNISFEEFLDWM